MEKIYIFNVQPLLIEDSTTWDVFYLRENSSKIHCLRIYDVELSFLLARLPSLTDDQFKQYMKLKLKNAKITYRNDLRESEYFTFGVNRLYAEIYSNNPNVLRDYVKTLKTELKYFYKRITPSTVMSPEDHIFYKNSETPFRFTATTTSLQASVYNLSCKYGIPLIGGAILDTSKIDEDYPSLYYPKISGSVKGLSFSKLKEGNALKKDESINFQRNMRLLAYDIETYTPEGVKKIDPLAKREYEIFALGLGIFALDNMIPIENICLVTKDIVPPSNLESKQITLFNRKTYQIKNEYGSNLPTDMAYYIICSNEKDLLECYIDILTKYSPQIITGFNTYGFDDRFVYRRCELYGLTQAYLQCFCYYDIDELSSISWWRPFAPAFKDEIPLKIDNRMRKDNASVMSWNVLCTDVYKIMLKEDPKRFTQQGYGNLNTMLSVYKVVNPYNNEPLSKTDMEINEMFRRWKTGDGMYEVALYCRQDAWITGTLIIKRAKFGDMIELSTISYTSFRDSIFKADGMRVNNRIIAEAYSQGFALKDEKSDERMDIIENKEDIIELGGKKFDSRTIVGGAVKNLHPGLHHFVEASDFSSMYPSQKEANMADSSSRVDEEIIENPERYGLQLVKTQRIIDMYGDREIKYFKKK